MADISALTVQERDRAGKGAARATRREGLVPGVIYGDNQDPTLISMTPRDLFVEMHKPGFATRIFDITVGSKAPWPKMYKCILCVTSPFISIFAVLAKTPS